VRILIGADTYAPHVNGASYFAQRLAVALTARHEVHVVAPSTDTRNHAGMSSDGVVEHRVRSLPVPGHSRFRFCPPLGLRAAARRILDEVQPDVVHVQSHVPLCRALVDAAHERGLFVIATSHFMPETLIHYLPIGNAGRTRAHEWIWRDAARVFAKADIVTARPRTPPRSPSSPVCLGRSCPSRAASTSPASASRRPRPSSDGPTASRISLLSRTWAGSTPRRASTS
jgi:glycosyltransferase involved in cell wall biosynthesis